MYKEWADGQVLKVKNILNSAREEHTSAVKQRIESVQELGGVIDVTKQLFEVSKVIAPENSDAAQRADCFARKLPRSRLRLSKWNKRLPWHKKPSPSSTHGSDMRDK
jgi:hypothetical protein